MSLDPLHSNGFSIPRKLIDSGQLTEYVRHRFGGEDISRDGLFNIDWNPDSWAPVGITTGYAQYTNSAGRYWDPAVILVARSPITLQVLLDFFVPTGTETLILGGDTDVITTEDPWRSKRDYEEPQEQMISLVAFATYGYAYSPSHVSCMDFEFTSTPIIVESVSEVSNELIRRLAEYPKERFTLRPRVFEKVVAEVLSRMGYDVTLTPHSGDSGRDVIASIGTPLDPLLMLVECKRYSESRLVDPAPISRLWCRMIDEGANIGMVVTTSGFQPVTRREAALRTHQLSLKDGRDFTSWVRQVAGSKTD